MGSKRMGYYTVLSFHIGSIGLFYLQFKRGIYSRVVNEKLVAAVLDAEALAGDLGAVDGHQLRHPGLEPPAVPLFRERAAWKAEEKNGQKEEVEPAAGGTRGARDVLAQPGSF